VRLVDGDGGKEALNAGDQGDRHHRHAEIEPASRGKPRREVDVQQIARQPHPIKSQPEGERNRGGEGDRGERTRDLAHRRRQPRPDEQNRQGQAADEHGVVVVPDDLTRQRQEVLDRRTLRRTTEQHVQLAEHDGHTNPGEHSVHDRR
jgi:hypothetical protein